MRESQLPTAVDDGFDGENFNFGWGDEQRYFSEARQYITRLEELMLAELEVDQVRDAGWDTDSIREDFGDGYNGSTCADPSP